MTPAPFVGMLHVDATHIGGAFATHRHAFGILPPKPVSSPPKPEVAPPPRRVLAQGPVASPELSQAQVEALQSDLQTLAEALQLELEAVKAEAEMVSGPALRTEPDLYKSIAVVGPVLSPQQIRNVLTIDARELGSLADRILSGSMAPYLTDEQRGILETVSSDAKALVAYLQQFDLQPLAGPAAQLAQDHVETHVKAANQLLAAAERKVVSDEAASVPVVEPAERGNVFGTLLAIGALVTVGILIAELA